MAPRSRASCRASAACIASGCCSQRRVLPSMSLNRKVTVPLGTFALCTVAVSIVRAPALRAQDLPPRCAPPAADAPLRRMVYTAKGSPCRAACTTKDGPETLLGTRPLSPGARSALVSRRVLRPARALPLEEAVLAREPQRVVPQLAGIFPLGHRVDYRPEHARALAVVQHERGHAERLELVYHAFVLALDLLARARVGERRRPQAAVQARLG